MAIRIIKKGQLPEEKRYKAKCDHCGTEIEFLRADAILRTPRDQRDDSELHVPCPLCTAAIVTSV